jgi:PIN domain nuclease of toxin-antitoxin system
LLACGRGRRQSDRLTILRAQDELSVLLDLTFRIALETDSAMKKSAYERKQPIGFQLVRRCCTAT